MKTAKFEISANIETLRTVQDHNFNDDHGLFPVFWENSNVMCFEYDDEDDEIEEMAQENIQGIIDMLDYLIGSDNYDF